jgi:tetratricopeptide (TPR) repeat protein
MTAFTLSTSGSAGAPSREKAIFDAAALNAIAAIANDLGDFDRALGEYERALATLRPHVEPNDFRVGLSLRNIARAKLRLGRPESALADAEGAVASLRERKGAELIACPTCGRIQVDLFTLVKEVEKKLMPELELPIKVAVMGCIVNGPGEAEGADVAVFAGDRRGIIYVQGQRVANVPEEEILERLLKECKEFEARVKRGEAKLGEKVVEIVPPDPIGELGSGKEKIKAGLVEQITVRAT